MIGKVITSLLKANADLLALISADNIYPYIINEGTLLPAIIYMVDSLVPGYCKDGWVGDEYMFSILSFSDDYAILQQIVDEVRNALELEKGVTEGIGYERICLTGQSEGYNITENVFLNRLTFSTVVKSY